MTHRQEIAITPRIQQAIAEIEGLIRGRFPDATFSIGEGEDPEEIYLTAIVDVEDRGAFIDLFIDRLVTFQVEDDLPIYVLPRRTPERTVAMSPRHDHRTAATAGH